MHGLDQAFPFSKLQLWASLLVKGRKGIPLRAAFYAQVIRLSSQDMSNAYALNTNLKLYLSSEGSLLYLQVIRLSSQDVPTAYASDINLELHLDSEGCLMYLQVIRLSSQDVPTAYAFELEAATIVQPEQVIEAVHKVVGTPVPA